MKAMALVLMLIAGNDTIHGHGHVHVPHGEHQVTRREKETR